MNVLGATLKELSDAMDWALLNFVIYQRKYTYFETLELEEPKKNYKKIMDLQPFATFSLFILVLKIIFISKHSPLRQLWSKFMS